MLNETSLIIDATRKASRFLQRDYFELENLQLSEKGNSLFCKKSHAKALKTLKDSLSKYSKHVITDIEDIQKEGLTSTALLVEVLDDVKNFERALPFFGIMVTAISCKDGKISAEISVMNFPALGEIYYAENGRGAWLERIASNFTGASRTRVSGVANVSDTLVSIPSEQSDQLGKKFHHIRYFNSHIYSLALLICGKIDAFVIPQSSVSSHGIRLFTLEAGGQSTMQDGLLLASNLKLHEKIKQVIY